MLVVNASNREKDLDWFMAHKLDNVDILDISDQTGLIALQGPKSRSILQNIFDINLNEFDFYWFDVA